MRRLTFCTILTASLLAFSHAARSAAATGFNQTDADAEPNDNNTRGTLMTGSWSSTGVVEQIPTENELWQIVKAGVSAGPTGNRFLR